MNIKEIAKIVGVSKTTISRVLNNSESVAEETRKKVLFTIEQSGYYPNYIARSLKVKKTKTIGVLVPDIGNPFYFEVIRGIEKVMYKKDFNIMLCNSDYDNEKELRYIFLLASKKVDGIIAAPCSENSLGIKNLLKWKIPFVLLDIPQIDFNANGVYIDHSNCSYIAADYLIKNGHTDIILIDAKRIKDAKSKFTEGYARALKEHNISLKEENILQIYPDINNGYSAIKKLIKSKRKFSAIIAINDLISIGAYRAANVMGLRIPKDISVIGNDDIPLAKFLTPPLTTIHQPKLLLGYKSAELLLDYIDSDNDSEITDTKTLTLDVRLIKRGSVLRRTENEN